VVNKIKLCLFYITYNHPPTPFKGGIEPLINSRRCRTETSSAQGIGGRGRYDCNCIFYLKISNLTSPISPPLVGENTRGGSGAAVLHNSAWTLIKSTAERAIRAFRCRATEREKTSSYWAQRRSETSGRSGVEVYLDLCSEVLFDFGSQNSFTCAQSDGAKNSPPLVGENTRGGCGSVVFVICYLGENITAGAHWSLLNKSPSLFRSFAKWGSVRRLARRDLGWGEVTLINSRRCRHWNKFSI